MIPPFLSRRRFLALAGSHAIATVAIDAAATPVEPRSYYAPTKRTTFPLTGQYWKPRAKPVMTGAPVDCLVVCDYARCAYAFGDGRLKWTRDFPDSWPRAACLHEGILYMDQGPYLLALDPATGKECRRIGVPGYHAPINSVDFWSFGGEVIVTLCFDRGGSQTVTEGQSVHCLKFIDGELQEFWRCRVNSVHPRHAEYRGVGLIVADTFGGVVEIVDPASSRVMASTEVYYPNTAKLLDGGMIQICSEHANRVFNWNPVTGEREMVMSAPVWPYIDPEVDGEIIRELELNTFDGGSPLEPQASRCAVDASGRYTLYSPNAASAQGNLVMIADCDNHRVIVMENREIITEITGFNNPVNAIFL